MSRQLVLPPEYPLPGIVTDVADGDTMVAGDEDHYLRVGLSALARIEEALPPGRTPATILDLPCGHGRVARVLRARFPSASLTVCDIDADGVEFCARAFNADGFVSSGDFRTLDLGRQFDLIWVGSLLTHLSAERTGHFLDFARRHMNAGSTLIVTTHGRPVIERLRRDGYGLDAGFARDLIEQHRRGGHGYRGYDDSPDYGFSLTACVWLETLLADSPLRLAAFSEGGWDDHQDVVVLRPAAGAAPAYTRTFFETRTSPTATPVRPYRDGDLDLDEAWYANQYPDVGQAIADGTVASSAQHFNDYGWREGRHPFDPARSYTERTAARPEAWIDDARRSRVVEAVWSESPEQQAARVGQYWMAHPSVRARSNRFASGRGDADAYNRLAELLIGRGWTLPIRRAISVGCGFGALERDLVRRGLVQDIVGFDLSAEAIRVARDTASELGLSGISYVVADLEDFRIEPASIDVAFAHASVHHVERLEQLYAAIRSALRPGGIFHLHEYVGPDRFQWTDTQLRLGTLFLDSLPERLRRQVDGSPKPPLVRPTVAEMIAADPSESVRSSALVSALRADFEILEERALGGALAHNALGGIAQNFDPNDPEDEAALERLFAIEDDAMRAGLIGSDFATVTATPKHQPISGTANTMTRSLTARATSLVPPVRRLYDAINVLHRSVEALRVQQQDDIRPQIDALRARTDRIEAALATPPSVPAQAPARTEGPDRNDHLRATLDRETMREMGEAARRHLPFLPGVFEESEQAVTVAGYCGAPDGLTERMRFFINGEPIDDVEYPITDPELKTRFPDVPGMGLVFRARITQNLDQRRRERFWRFDAAPNGRYDPNAWAQAIHYVNPATERFPFPPEANIRRVIGDTSVERFAMGGATIFKNAEHFLTTLGHGWTDFPQILDWGCGAGRLSRYLVGETGSTITGVDIDPDNIAWCQRTYQGGHFHTVPLRPRTSLDDERFDLVFGLSVMTHLQEQDQFAWLEELQRITRPGAFLLLSIQGPTQFAYNKFPPHLYRRIQEVGYLDLQRDDALADVVSDQEYYRSAMQSRPYVTRTWGRYFEVVAIVDAIAGLQDFVVLRKR